MNAHRCFHLHEPCKIFGEGPCPGLAAVGPACFKPSEIAPHEPIRKTLSVRHLSKVSYSQNNNYVAWETMITAHEPGNGFLLFSLMGTDRASMEGDYLPRP